MTIQWLNLGINAALWVCCFLAVWGVMRLFKGEGELWAAGLCPLIGMIIGLIASLIWPIARL